MLTPGVKYSHPPTVSANARGVEFLLVSCDRDRFVRLLQGRTFRVQQIDLEGLDGVFQVLDDGRVDGFLVNRHLPPAWAC